MSNVTPKKLQCKQPKDNREVLDTMSNIPPTTTVPSPVSIDIEGVAKVKDVVIEKVDAKDIKEKGRGLLIKFLDAFFTFATIFACVVFPYTFLQNFAPQFMTSFITSPLVFLAVPYVIIMALVGVKISSMFGCEMWQRFTTKK